MINFCTLFDSNYLTRGLALYESLAKVCPSFHLYVIAFNKDCYQFLKEANLPNLTPVSLKEFEDEELLRVKPTRSAAEYCWTCTPSVILYCIQKYNLPFCIYTDADMVFYQDPQVILNELGNKSILITEHRYTKEYDQSATSGIYCVQFMYFKNNTEGLTALKWWRERCIEWCYDRKEEGKFGDQKYLDDWPERFSGVHVMRHPGGGVAPWNVQQFKFVCEEGAICLIEKKTGQKHPLVFFHFHGLKFYANDVVSYSISLYEMGREVKKLVFDPYVQALQVLKARTLEMGATFNVTGARIDSPSKPRIYSSLIKERLVQFSKGRISFMQLATTNFRDHYHYHKLACNGANN
jgi:hypothetical protein